MEPVLIWPGVERHRQVGDGRVLRLAGAVADNRGPARAMRHVDRLYRLGQGADLVELDEDAVRGALADGTLQAPRVGDQQVVADELDAARRDAR